ncbi:hypothetical protein BH10BAC6_BH10BAC6_03450 [soil metagenome]
MPYELHYELCVSLLASPVHPALAASSLFKRDFSSAVMDEHKALNSECWGDVSECDGGWLRWEESAFEVGDVVTFLPYRTVKTIT